MSTRMFLTLLFTISQREGTDVLVSCTYRITDKAVTAIARSCTRLRYIDLACSFTFLHHCSLNTQTEWLFDSERNRLQQLDGCFSVGACCELTSSETNRISSSTFPFSSSSLPSTDPLVGTGDEYYRCITRCTPRSNFTREDSSLLLFEPHRFGSQRPTSTFTEIDSSEFDRGSSVQEESVASFL